MSTTISTNTHERMIHKLEQYEHELELIADEHEIKPCPHRLNQAEARLEGAREIFGIFNGNW